MDLSYEYHELSQDSLEFKNELHQECYSYGWGRGLTRSMYLYEKNKRLELELKQLKMKLQEIISGKNPQYMILKINNNDKNIS